MFGLPLPIHFYGNFTVKKSQCKNAEVLHLAGIAYLKNPLLPKPA
jgi:hypothetical protein